MGMIDGWSSFSAQRPAVGHHSSGKERDSESGLDYFLARYYSGAQGRFTSPDEFKGGIVDPFSGQQASQPGPLPYADIADPQTLNKYVYVRNNPLRYIDPDGHDFWDFLSGATNAFSTNFFAGVGRQSTSNTDYRLGQAVGDAAATIVGTVETVLGGGGMVGGLALDATGVGAVVGVPANVIAGAAVVQGATAAVTGVTYLAKGVYDATAENADRMKAGKAPVGKDGNPVELHHAGGKQNSPLEEMTRTEHRGPGNYTKNHPDTNKSPSQIDREKFRQKREKYWKNKINDPDKE
jgi:RHS repeat-associated protein